MPSPTSTLPVTDLGAREMYANPFPRYARLRAEAPISLATAPMARGQAYMATRYDDVLTVHTDVRFSSDPNRDGESKLGRRTPRMFRLLTDSMVFKDDPQHKRLRGLVNKAFTPKRVAQMEADIEATAVRLVDQIDPSSGPVDIVDRLATPLPLSVIATMLGINERDREAFHRDVVKAATGVTEGLRGLLHLIPASRRLIKLFDRLAADRRTHPDDGLITALVEVAEGDDQLGDDEIIAMIYLLLLAGHDTTSNLIGNSLVSLTQNREQLERLRDDPGIAGSAVEELLRFTSPVPFGTTRYTLEDLELGGIEIAKGSQVFAMLISANRDESMFERSEELDLGRQNNKHLAFAFGPHYCLGNQLARLEARSALKALVARFDEIDLAIGLDDIRYKPTPTLRGPAALPLRLRG